MTERRQTPDRRASAPKIACPYCGGYDNKVVRTGPLVHHDGVYRRRECVTCVKRFNTQEIVIDLPTIPAHRYI